MKKRVHFLSVILILLLLAGCKESPMEPAAVLSISISDSTLTLIQGETHKLTARVYNGTAGQKTVLWESSDNSVASVSEDGLVTALSIGNATIIAHVEDVIARCEVAVVKEGDYETKVRITQNGHLNVNKLIVVLPAPSTNEYQTITNLHGNCGEYFVALNSNKILYYLEKKFSNELEVYQTFDYEPNHINIDFSKTPDKKNIYGSIPPENYIISDGTYIDTTNCTIKAISDSIWALSDGVIDYARRCYEFEANKLKYIKGSWRSIQQIILEGGGECGDFSTFYINLMVRKGIPARHNMGVVPGGGWHVWADFYDDVYGWIPVDVTFKNGNPEGDYFGKYNTDLIIMSQGLTSLHRDGLDINFNPIQSYWWWYWYGSGSGNLNAEFSLNGVAQ